jgi:hypothetical protein
MHATGQRELDARLGALAEECGAGCAFVVDSSGEVFGATEVVVGGARREVDEVVPLLGREIEARMPARGGHVHLVRAEEAPFVVAESFAGIYMVVMVFEGAFAAQWVVGRIHRALPEIEALTVGLPPRDPQREASAQRLARRGG